MKNILIPIDFSKSSLKALKTAANFCNKFGGKINLVRVNEEHQYSQNVEGNISGLNKESLYHDEELGKKSKHMLQRLNETMIAFVPKINRGSVYLVTDPLSDVWPDILNNCNPDMVITCSLDSKKFIEFLTSSKTEVMIRNSEIPVLVISEEEEMKSDRILIATDVGKTLPKKLVELCQFFYSTGAEINFACVINVDLLSEEDVRKKIDLLARAYGIDKYEIHIKSEMNIATGIIEIANEIGSDIILMKTYEKSPFWQFIQSSVAEEVINKANIPTLIEKVDKVE